MTGTRARCREENQPDADGFLHYATRRGRRRGIMDRRGTLPTPPARPDIWLLCPSSDDRHYKSQKAVFCSHTVTLCGPVTRRPFCDWFDAKRQTFAADDCNKQHFVLQNEAFRMFFALF